MRGQWELLKESSAVARTATGALFEDTRTLYAAQGLVARTVLPALDEGMAATQPNTDALYDSANQIAENMDALAAGHEALVAAELALGGFAEEQASNSNDDTCNKPCSIGHDL